ncbi:MAG TPA: OB-fold nucleic acid binding domain-containing protein [Candidatus Dormibacteraeota bacterium]|nr:OB-fold nucleic acid binding domain-containing protein [Candidatus Dormibacteraeota bacterium]
MKQFFVKDAATQENQVITSSFLVSSKQIKPKKSGEIYLALTLCDRSGQIDAKMWDNVNDAVDKFEQDDFIKVRGLINKYSSRYQLTIHKLRRMEDSEVEYSDYLPKTAKDVDELWRTLGASVASFSNEHLRLLLEAFMGDPQIAEAYRQAPAAKSLHHAFIGGLLEHVVSLMKLCDTVAPLYPQINRDLLLAGAFLHDIGKIYELNYQRSFSYTTKGQLLGHMIIELEMLHEKLALVPGFPAELKILLEHLIISHHGKYEFGSPKLPMFPEALMLHYLDDLDSKMESMRAHFERDPEAEWSGYNGSLGRTLLNSEKVLAKLAAPAQPIESSPDCEVLEPEVNQLKVAAGEN